jgi:hypothetical protein
MPADLRAPLERLIETWRSHGRAIDTFHATMGTGYHACADELAALLALPAETPAPRWGKPVERAPMHYVDEVGETPAPETPRPQGDSDHWCVEVSSHGENLVTIESRILAGKPDLTPHEAGLIRTAGEHLLAFIGRPAPETPPSDLAMPPPTYPPPIGICFDDSCIRVGPHKVTESCQQRCLRCGVVVPDLEGVYTLSGVFCGRRCYTTDRTS